MPKIIVFPFRSYLQTPIGIIEIQATQNHIHQIRFCNTNEPLKVSVENELTQLCEKELGAYFEGKTKTFALPTQQDGTDFMQEVWNNVKKIPYAQTASYADLAKRAGDEN